MNRPFHIMIIDDDVVFTQSMELILQQHGYTVTTAHTGAGAFEFIMDGIVPDIILLDITLPDMDGFAIFNKIRESNSIPVIFVTGTFDSNTELMCLQMGAVDFITKPFVVDILLARLRNHLTSIYTYKPTIESIPVGETGTLAVQLDQDKLNQMKQLLTESEYRIGKRIALGYTNQEIADELNYSYSYVKKVAYRIFDKLGISKRIEIRPFFTN